MLCSCSTLWRLVKGCKAELVYSSCSAVPSWQNCGRAELQVACQTWQRAQHNDASQQSFIAVMFCGSHRTATLHPMLVLLEVLCTGKRCREICRTKSGRPMGWQCQGMLRAYIRGVKFKVCCEIMQLSTIEIRMFIVAQALRF